MLCTATTHYPRSPVLHSDYRANCTVHAATLLQAYYLAAPLPVERAPTSPLKGLKRRRDSVRISRLTDFPVNGFVIEGTNLQEMADVVGQAALLMQARNIPHNMLISDSGSRIFLFPQCFAEKQARGEVAEELLDTGEHMLQCQLHVIE